MSIGLKLTVRHLRMNRRRTIITILGIALSVAMVTAISGMVVSFQDMYYNDSVLRDGLWHVRYAGLDDETTAAVAREPIFSAYAITRDEEGEPLLELQFARLHKGIFDESEAVCQRYGIEQGQVRYHNDLLVAKGIVPGPYYNALYGFAGILLLLVAAGSVMVIANAFTISADQRSKQFGLLRSAGATRSQIRGIVLCEGVVLAAISLPLGILAGFFAEWVALSIANNILRGMPSVKLLAWFRVVVSPAALVVSVAAACLTILLAAWFPAKRAAAVSPVDAIRQTRQVRISPRSVRVSPLTARLFGFEGVLAAKTMKRSRGKYRTTVLSLVVSIVLYIGGSSFGDLLFKSTGMVYQDVGYNVHIQILGGDEERQDRLGEEIAAWKYQSLHTHRKINGSVQAPEETLTAESVEYFGNGPRPATIYSLGGEQFAQLCKKLRTDPADYLDPQAPKAILINDIGTYIRQGRRTSFTPYKMPEGTTLTVENGDWSVELTVHGQVSEVPDGLLTYFDQGGLSVIVSEEVRRAIQPENYDSYRILTVLAEDAAAFAQKTQELLEVEMEPRTYLITDFEELVATNRNIGTLVMIFVYGFVAMLSLIGITNIVTTISTHIALRRREFAMLRSAGMTGASIGKMLSYESLLYGVKSLIIGVPLGLAASFLMYWSLNSAMDFQFIWPVTSVVVSVVAVLALTFSTMAFARSRQKRDNIVDALREEII